jgi:ribosomal protein S6--L-glutamate ligase
VVRQFEQMDVYTPITANGITNSRDKLRADPDPVAHDIGMPKTAFVRNRQDVLPAIDRVGGAPVVIKLLEGTQGIGVILAPDRKVAEAIIETLHNTKQNVLIQEFVAESKGRDIRALVVGDRVVAAMRRTAQGDEFRSNVHRGGSVEAVSSTPPTSAPPCGGTDHGAAGRRCRHAGGQRRTDGDGGQLLTRPGGHRTGDRARRGRGDHRLRREPGGVPRARRPPAAHGQHRLRVAELLVREDGDFVGKTIGEAGLRDRDITVLTLHRDTDVIPNPGTLGCWRATTGCCASATSSRCAT